MSLVLQLQGFVDKSTPAVVADFLNQVDWSKALWPDLSVTVNQIQLASPSGQTQVLTVNASFFILLANTNTGPTSFQLGNNPAVNPAVNILNADLSALSPGQLIAGTVVMLRFDGTQMVVMSQSNKLFPAGSQGQPSISFTVDAATGWFSSASGLAGFSGRMEIIPPAGNVAAVITVHGNDAPGQRIIQVLDAGNDLLVGMQIRNTLDGSQSMMRYESRAGSGSTMSMFATGASFNNGNIIWSHCQPILGPVNGFWNFPDTGSTAQLPTIFAVGADVRILLPALAGAGIKGYGFTANAFLDMTPDSGNFTGTLSGTASTIQGNFQWVKAGFYLMMTATVGLIGTGNSGTTLSMTGVPAQINNYLIPGMFVPFYGVVDNNIAQMGLVQPQANGSLVFSRIAVSGSNLTAQAFTASTVRGITSGATFFFPLVTT